MEGREVERFLQSLGLQYLDSSTSLPYVDKWSQPLAPVVCTAGGQGGEHLYFVITFTLSAMSAAFMVSECFSIAHIIH